MVQGNSKHTLCCYYCLLVQQAHHSGQRHTLKNDILEVTVAEIDFRASSAAVRATNGSGENAGQSSIGKAMIAVICQAPTFLLAVFTAYNEIPGSRLS